MIIVLTNRLLKDYKKKLRKKLYNNNGGSLKDPFGLCQLFFVLVLFIQRKEAKLIVRMHVALVLLFASEDMSKKFHIKCNL